MDPQAVPIRTVVVIPEVLPDHAGGSGSGSFYGDARGSGSDSFSGHSGGSGSLKKTDPYDVDDYDDPDDFAEEWAEEFGDDDYDDGYDDAYDYWEEEYDD